MRGFFASSTDPEELQDLIKLLGLQKLVGTNSIPTSILKNF